MVFALLLALLPDARYWAFLPSSLARLKTKASRNFWRVMGFYRFHGVLPKA
jgi:hypothetical protein